MAKAKATGTLKNTGNAASTFSAHLEVMISHPTNPYDVPSTAYSIGYAVALAAGATSPQITIPDANGLDVGDAEGGVFKARVVIDLISPISRLGIASSPWIEVVGPTYGVTWTGTQTIGSGPVRISGDGVDAVFDMSIGEGFPWKIVVVGVALAGAIWYFGRKRK